MCYLSLNHNFLILGQMEALTVPTGLFRHEVCLHVMLCIDLAHIKSQKQLWYFLISLFLSIRKEAFGGKVFSALACWLSPVLATWFSGPSARWENEDLCLKTTRANSALNQVWGLLSIGPRMPAQAPHPGRWLWFLHYFSSKKRMLNLFWARREWEHLPEVYFF